MAEPTGRQNRPARGRQTRPVPEVEPDESAIEQPERLPAAPGTDSTGTYANNDEITERAEQPTRGLAQRPDRFPPSRWEQLDEEQRWAEIERMKQEGSYHGIAPQV